MSIEFSCACGKKFKVRDALAGKKGKCAGCGGVVLIPKPPEPEPEPEPVAAGVADIYSVEDPVVQEPVWTVQRGEGVEEDPDFATAAGTPAAAAVNEGGRTRKARDFLYLCLGLVLVPLLLSTFGSAHDSMIERIKATVHSDPTVEAQVAQIEDEGPLTRPQLLRVLPGHRVTGALLAGDSEAHWLFALIAAGGFFGVALVLMPTDTTKPRDAFLTGVFTGTVGILLLLLVQLIADHMRGLVVRRGLILFLLKMIQLSYDAANDPETGFFLSAIGFTVGVGLCEELCKALPILFHFRTKGTLDWRGACLWGFLSGAGFGVAEAIMYCGNSYHGYNGLSGGDIYLVRFVSCIGLHGIWAAAAGIFIWKHRKAIEGAENGYALFFTAAALVAAPVVLHGLYDTMLKKDMPGAALGVAVISFGWLVFLVEQAWRNEGSTVVPRQVVAV